MNGSLAPMEAAPLATGAGPRRRAWELLLALPLAVVFAAFLLYPILTILLTSLKPGSGVLHSGGGGSSSHTIFSNYLELFRDPIYCEAMLHSLVLSASVALGATLLCLGPAWLFARYEFPGKRLMRAGFALPMSLSGILVGFLAVIMLGRVGFIPQMSQGLTGKAWLSGAAYQLSGLVIAYLYFEIPRGVVTLESALSKFDPRLDAAARSLGASRWQRFLWIVLPLIAPALVATFAVTFSVSLGSFGVALVLSKRFSVLPLELFHQVVAITNFPLASAMAVFLIALALALNFALGRWMRRHFSLRHA